MLKKLELVVKFCKFVWKNINFITKPEKLTINCLTGISVWYRNNA